MDEHCESQINPNCKGLFTISEEKAPVKHSKVLYGRKNHRNRQEMQIYRKRIVFVAIWMKRIWRRNSAKIKWRNWIAINLKKLKAKYEITSSYQRGKCSELRRENWVEQNFEIDIFNESFKSVSIAKRESLTMKF